MIVLVTMKTPDCLETALMDHYNANGFDWEDADYESFRDLCETRWFEFGEYLMVEVDTTRKTCKVVPV